MSDFLFPASRLVKEARESPDSGVCVWFSGPQLAAAVFSIHRDAGVE